jgi:hypothetical protein
MLQGLESIYDTTKDNSQRNYSDSHRMEQIAGLTTQMQVLTTAILGLQQRLGLREQQAARSEYLLWGQEQTRTMHCSALAKGYTTQLNQSVSLARSAA